MLTSASRSECSASRICALKTLRRSNSTTLPGANTFTDRFSRLSQLATAPRAARREPARHVTDRWQHIHGNDLVAAPRAEDIHRQRINHPAITIPVTIDLDRHTQAGNRGTGVNRFSHIPFAEDASLQGVEIGRDHEKPALETGERRILQPCCQMMPDALAANQPANRRDGKIQSSPQLPRSGDFRGKLFEVFASVARRPQGSHIGPHARPRDRIDRDAILFEDLDHPDMGKAPGGATR